MQDLIASTTPEQQAGFKKRIDALRRTYNEMSDIYQQSKRKGADLPLGSQPPSCEFIVDSRVLRAPRSS